MGVHYLEGILISYKCSIHGLYFTLDCTSSLFLGSLLILSTDIMSSSRCTETIVTVLSASIKKPRKHYNYEV